MGVIIKKIKGVINAMTVFSRAKGGGWTEGEGSLGDRVGRVIGRRGAWGVRVSALWADLPLTENKKTCNAAARKKTDITRQRKGRRD
jgi:hypothetical protein